MKPGIVRLAQALGSCWLKSNHPCLRLSTSSAILKLSRCVWTVASLVFGVAAPVFTVMARGFEWFIVLSKHFCKEKKASSYFILPFCCLRLQCPPSMSFFMSLQEPGEFPFSNHDNRHTLKDISVFSHVSMSEKNRTLWNVQSHYTLKGNHIFSMSCTVGCGAQEVFS